MAIKAKRSVYWTAGRAERLDDRAGTSWMFGWILECCYLRDYRFRAGRPGHDTVMGALDELMSIQAAANALAA